MNKIMNNNSDVGYLELFIGPMWSGKTSELVKLHKQYTFCNIPVLSINYSHDIRYTTNKICTHDLIDIPCVTCEELREISDITNGNVENDFNNSKVILINEGQFFKDIVNWVKCAVEIYHKQVIICGLDGDFKRNPFGDWLSLIPYCDKVSKMHSICGCCRKNHAIFTHRNTNEKQQELIGTEQYVPMCRLCYNSVNNQ
jgi:thymidine kinase